MKKKMRKLIFIKLYAFCNSNDQHCDGFGVILELIY